MKLFNKDLCILHHELLVCLFVCQLKASLIQLTSKQKREEKKRRLREQNVIQHSADGLGYGVFLFMTDGENTASYSPLTTLESETCADMKCSFLCHKLNWLHNS